MKLATTPLYAGLNKGDRYMNMQGFTYDHVNDDSVVSVGSYSSVVHAKPIHPQPQQGRLY